MYFFFICRTVLGVTNITNNCKSPALNIGNADLLSMNQINIPADANANKMIQALLNYMIAEGQMSESTANNIVDEGKRQ